MPLLVAAGGAVRRQLSEALATIAAADFPARWPQLLPALVEQLRQGSLAVKARPRVLVVAALVQGIQRRGIRAQAWMTSGA